MEKYKELENTVAEVYRKREAIMKEFNYDIKAYHKHLREVVVPEMEKAGFRCATEAELAKIKQSHKRKRETVL